MPLLTRKPKNNSLPSSKGVDAETSIYDLLQKITEQLENGKRLTTQMKLVMKHIDGLMTELSILEASEGIGPSSHDYDIRSCARSQLSDDSEDTTIFTPQSSISFSSGILTPMSDTTITEVEIGSMPPPTETVLSSDSIETLSQTTLSISDLSTGVDTNESAAEETNGVQVRCILGQLLRKMTVLSADLELIQWFVEQTVQSVMFGLLLTRSTHNIRWIAIGFGLGCITVIICVSMLDRATSAPRTKKSPPAFMTIGIETQ